MGSRAAIAVPFGRACLRGRVIPLGKGRLWIQHCVNRARRIWIESAQSAAGHARAHGYATRVCDFFDRRADLAKGPRRKWLDTTRSGLRVCAAYGGDVDQRPDRLRVSTTGHCSLSGASWEDATGGRAVEQCVVWLVAVGRFFRHFSRLGSRRDPVSTWLLSRGCGARIHRALWRDNSSAAAAPFLFAAPLAQIRAVECVDDRGCTCRSSFAKLAVPLAFS